MRIEWTPAAVASARRYMHDQDGMRAIGAAVSALADDPCRAPPGGFHRGLCRRLRAGACRIMYAVDEDAITAERVDRLLRPW